MVGSFAGNISYKHSFGHKIVSTGKYLTEINLFIT